MYFNISFYFNEIFLNEYKLVLIDNKHRRFKQKLF